MEESAPNKVSENDITAHVTYLSSVSWFLLRWCGGPPQPNLAFYANARYFRYCHFITLVCYAETLGPDPQHISLILVAAYILHNEA